VEALGNCPVCSPLNPSLFHGIHAMNVCGLKQHDINSYTHLLLGHLYWVFEEQEANRLVARRRRQWARVRPVLRPVSCSNSYHDDRYSIVRCSASATQCRVNLADSRSGLWLQTWAQIKEGERKSPIVYTNAEMSPSKILSCFKFSSNRLLASHCSKMYVCVLSKLAVIRR